MTKPNQYPQNISDILSGKICPYCEGQPELVDSIEVYDKSYGLIWLCRPCHAWVAVHQGTETPLGRLANQELREWKKKAHSAFDPIFSEGLINKIYPRYISGMGNREKAYLWLAEQLGIKVEYTPMQGGAWGCTNGKDKIELHPANASYKPIVVGSVDDFQIEGILAGLIRKIS